MTTTPIYDALFVEHTIATLTADLRATWEPETCRTCGVVPPSPCRDGGRFVKRHGGRS